MDYLLSVRFRSIGSQPPLRYLFDRETLPLGIKGDNHPLPVKKHAIYQLNYSLLIRQQNGGSL